MVAVQPPPYCYCVRVLTYLGGYRGVNYVVVEVIGVVGHISAHEFIAFCEHCGVSARKSHKVVAVLEAEILVVRVKGVGVAHKFEITVGTVVASCFCGFKIYIVGFCLLPVG